MPKQLLDAATNLYEILKAANKVADENLPKKLAGIVKLHSGIAVGSAFIPIPGADVAAAAGNIWTMYARINKEIGIPFGENIIKSIASGVATNLGGAAAGALVVGSAVKFIPGLGSLGGAAVMAGTIYGITIASGIIYMHALAKLEKKKLGNITNDDLKSSVDEILKDKNYVKDLLKDSKKEYNPKEHKK